MTETMIEKLARAMSNRREELIAQPLARIYPELVRAVLLALREPDEGMMKAMAPWLYPPYAHRAVIDHILNESGQPANPT